jgi:shikimate kinase
MRIFLIGMPGSGKSYWMQQLADYLQYEALDLDTFIEQRQQSSIPELFAISEAYFREKERMALTAAISEKADNIVISTGGGAPCYADNLQLMKQAGCVVYIAASQEVLLKNLSRPGSKRPLLKPESAEDLSEKVNRLYTQREFFYEQAHIKIDADNVSLTTFAALIQDYLRASQKTN